MVEAWTSATIFADEVIEVIIQAAPTDWMRPPKLDTRLAAQMARKVGFEKGASGAPAGFSGMSSMASASTRRRRTVPEALQ